MRKYIHNKWYVEVGIGNKICDKNDAKCEAKRKIVLYLSPLDKVH